MKLPRRLRLAAVAAVASTLGGCAWIYDPVTAAIANAPEGQSLPVSRFIPSSGRRVCLLGPYSEVTMPTRNAALKRVSSNHFLDEGEWAFVYQIGDRTSVQVHHRSRRVDVPPWPRPYPNVRRGYVSAQCVSVRTGTILRFADGGRQYFILAEPINS